MENKRKHKRLSISELKRFKGFVDYTNEQAEEVIATLEKISVLFFELFHKSKTALGFKKETKKKVEPIYSQTNTNNYDNNYQQRNVA